MMRARLPCVLSRGAINLSQGRWGRGGGGGEGGGGVIFRRKFLKPAMPIFLITNSLSTHLIDTGYAS